MDKLGKLDLEKVCRLCLSESNHVYSIFGEIQIIQTENFKLKIQHLLTRMVGIEFIDTEKLPNVVCRKCIQFLVKTSKFIQICLNSNKVIQTYYNELTELEVEEEGEVLIQNEGLYQDENSDDFNQNLSGEENTLEVEEMQNDLVVLKLRSREHFKYYLHTLECGDKEYTCNLCLSRFKNSDEFKEHMGTHGKNPYVCNSCEKSYRLYQHLLQHVQTYHKDEIQMKDIDITPEKIWTYYLKTLENDEQKYSCNLCDERFNYQRELKDHLFSHGDRPYCCNDCKKGFGDYRFLMKHIKRHVVALPYSCDLCEKKYKEGASLKIHKRVHKGEKPYLCSSCGKSFTTLSDLKKHLLSHSDERKHMCTYCGVRFKTSSSLFKHIRTHTRETQPQYQCSKCNKELASKYELKRHEIVHNGIKPFVCHMCSKAFNRNSNLQTHINSHLGNKPYICKVCNRRFSQAHSLKTHMEVHKRERNDEFDEIREKT